MTAPKKVAAIHDISGLGRCSLTVIIPVLSAMGVQVCPVPTAVLSAHTGYGEFVMRDLTDYIDSALDHYKRMGVKFDCVYSGFLASSEQIDHCLDFFASFPEALITTYREGAFGRGALEESMRWADAVLIGPGLGTDKTAEEILRCALAFGELPLVMDADALNLMAAHPDLWDFVRVPCVITPHAAEMSRISGIGENKLRELMDSGELEYIQNGNRRLLADAAIWDWYERAKRKVAPQNQEGGK